MTAEHETTMLALARAAKRLNLPLRDWLALRDAALAELGADGAADGYPVSDSTAETALAQLIVAILAEHPEHAIVSPDHCDWCRLSTLALRALRLVVPPEGWSPALRAMAAREAST